jgi:hypothetical protein
LRGALAAMAAFLRRTTLALAFIAGIAAVATA